ncbi:MAG: ferrous iron transport protein A [Candidatus Methanofastidiosia archaeon]
MLTLDRIGNKEKVKIVEILGGWFIRHKLTKLGIHPGDHVSVSKSGLFRGPLHIKVNGNEIALGRRIASKIIVEVVK